jgi:hypothetical protein
MRRLAIGIAMIVACSGTEPADPCEELVTLTVAVQEKTVAQWVPACKINRLVATTADFGQDMWAIESTTLPNDLIGPITYGELPAGAAQEHPPQLLQAGTSYTVVLSVVDSDGSSMTVGTKTFTAF